MPKGVEHLHCRPLDATSRPQESLMPKGVEHEVASSVGLIPRRQPQESLMPKGEESLMPKGVEHLHCRPLDGATSRRRTAGIFDAERR